MDDARVEIRRFQDGSVEVEVIRDDGQPIARMTVREKARDFYGVEVATRVDVDGLVFEGPKLSAAIPDA